MYEPLACEAAGVFHSASLHHSVACLRRVLTESLCAPPILGGDFISCLSR